MSHFIQLFGTISAVSANGKLLKIEPKIWAYLNICPLKMFKYTNVDQHNFFLNKNSVVDLDPEFLFVSGTREKPSGYTTHEITIFKYKMGDFFFWPKKTVYQQLRFHFDILRFYQDFTFLIFAVWFFIMGDAFQW